MTRLGAGIGKILHYAGGETICGVQSNGAGHVRLVFCSGRSMEVLASLVEGDSECGWPPWDIRTRVSVHGRDRATMIEEVWEE